MKINRREVLNSYIQEKGKARLSELEALFPEVSAMTLRRDLAYLEENGYLVRIRGGARALKKFSGGREELLSNRENDNYEYKQQIAQKALQQLGKGRSVYLDCGSTIMHFARLIPDERLNITTGAPNIALEIGKNPLPVINMLGGRLNMDNIATSGMPSLEFIKTINIDVAFMATSGFSIDSGFTSGDFNECELKRAVIKKAHKVIMLMDHSKVGKSMPYTFAELEDIDILISDELVSEEMREYCRNAGVELL